MKMRMKNNNQKRKRKRKEREREKERDSTMDQMTRIMSNKQPRNPHTSAPMLTESILCLTLSKSKIRYSCGREVLPLGSLAVKG